MMSLAVSKTSLLKPHRAVTVIACDKDGRFLLQFRDSKAANPLRWSFFGGSAEDGEMPAEAMAREFTEEIGIVLPLSRFTLVADYDDGKQHGYRYVYRLEGSINGNDICLGEGAGFGFFTREEVHNLHQHGYVADWMSAVLQRCMPNA